MCAELYTVRERVWKFKKIFFLYKFYRKMFYTFSSPCTIEKEIKEREGKIIEFFVDLCRNYYENLSSYLVHMESINGNLYPMTLRKSLTDNFRGVLGV